MKKTLFLSLILSVFVSQITFSQSGIYPPDGTTDVPLTVTLKWDAMESDSFTAESYEVYMNEEGEETSMLGAPSYNHWTCKNLKPNTKYEWSYVGQDKDGNYLPGGSGYFVTKGDKNVAKDNKTKKKQSKDNNPSEKASSKGNEKKAIKYLEKQIKHEATMWLTKQEQKVLDADVINARLFVDLKNTNINYNIVSNYFLRHKENFHPFDTPKDIITSKEFINALNPNFTLKTEEDAIMLRSVFYAIDQTTKGIIFKQNDKWIIVNKKWFGELLYFKITTNSKGKITEIIYEEGWLQKPETIMGKNPNINFDNSNYQFSELYKNDITQLLRNSYESYKFELEPIKLTGLKENVKIFDGNLAVTKKHNNISNTFKQSFVLIKNAKKYSLIANKEDLIRDETFIEAMSKAYTIKNTTEAQDFENLLDEIVPVGSFAEKEKKHYQKENIWCFVRDKTFDDEEGILVLTNKKGKILYMDNFRKIDGSAIIKMKMHDPNFKIDYAFKLVEPSSKNLTLQSGETVPVKITLNADAANAMNLYIATFSDNQMIEFDAGDLEPLFTTNINSFLFDGKYTLEYVLLPSGKKNKSEALASIEMTINVEGGINSEQKKEIDKLVENTIISIQNEDYKALENTYATEKNIKNILKKLGNNKKENRLKEYLENLNRKQMSENAKANLEELKVELKKAKQDIKNIAFRAYGEQSLDLATPNLKAMSLSFMFQTEILVGYIKAHIILTENKIYLIELKPKTNLIPRDFMGD